MTRHDWILTGIPLAAICLIILLSYAAGYQRGRER